MKDFKKYYLINAEPEEVYTALTNPFTIELWSGYPAVMDENPDTEFSLWEGDITGKNIEIEKNKKVIQQWYFDGQPEESVVTIKLFSDKKGTQVELNHKNIPDEVYDNIVEGWNDFYFGAIKEFFEVE